MIYLYIRVENIKKTAVKLILKVLKWIGKFLLGLLILIITAGLCNRLFSSKPTPPGKLIDVNGTKLHIRAEGQKNDLPTLVLEAGASGNTDGLHWINEGLKKSMRVVRYDREGQWYSESSKDSLTSEHYAHQLYELLEKSGEKPPYILAGHSIGGSYNRIFRDLYPNEVKGLVFIDSTHPDHNKSLTETGYSIPQKQITFYKFLSILADMGILGLYDKIIGIKSSKDLSNDCQIRIRDRSFYSGKVFRRLIKEVDNMDNILLRSGRTNSLDSLPVLVFTATEKYSESRIKRFKNRGVDLEKHQQLWFEMQKDLKELSTNGKQFNIDASHSSIITTKENAEIINKEILLMAETVK